VVSLVLRPFTELSRIASTIRVSHGGVDGDRITIVGGYEDESWLGRRYGWGGGAAVVQ
jgi:hypothetical protein